MSVPEILLRSLIAVCLFLGGTYTVYQLVKIVTYAFYRAKHKEDADWKRLMCMDMNEREKRK